MDEVYIDSQFFDDIKIFCSRLCN